MVNYLVRISEQILEVRTILEVEDLMFIGVLPWDCQVSSVP